MIPEVFRINETLSGSFFDNHFNSQAADFDKYIKIARDELEASQYEEAAKHFDQAYVINSDWLAFFLRSYAQSHVGTRGNVLPDSQKFTNAFDSSVKKLLAENDEKTKKIGLQVLISYYWDAMVNLEDNAVSDANGQSPRSEINHTKYASVKDALVKVKSIAKEDTTDFKEYYKKGLMTCRGWFKKEIDDIMLELDPTYERPVSAGEQLIEKIKKLFKKS